MTPRIFIASASLVGCASLLMHAGHTMADSSIRHVPNIAVTMQQGNDPNDYCTESTVQQPEIRKYPSNDNYNIVFLWGRVEDGVVKQPNFGKITLYPDVNPKIPKNTHVLELDMTMSCAGSVTPLGDSFVYVYYNPALPYTEPVDQENSTKQPAIPEGTRPRVKGQRVQATAEGTIYIVRKVPNASIDRVYLLTDVGPYSFKAKRYNWNVSEVAFDQRDYFVNVAALAGPSGNLTPQQIVSEDDLNFINLVKQYADSMGLPVPEP